MYTKGVVYHSLGNMSVLYIEILARRPLAIYRWVRKLKQPLVNSEFIIDVCS